MKRWKRSTRETNGKSNCHIEIQNKTTLPIFERKKKNIIRLGQKVMHNVVKHSLKRCIMNINVFERKENLK